MILITGGAGFLGSNLIASLNERGQTDIAIYDTFQSFEQWKNLRGKQFALINSEQRLRNSLNDGTMKLTSIVHLAAITDTAFVEQDRILETNFFLSVWLMDIARQAKVPFIYASSAATYGDGTQGFSDATPPTQLRPLNLYGWSKNLFDQYALDKMVIAERFKISSPFPQVVGFKFFNVYGPNEYHKGKMASLLWQAYSSPTAVAFLFDEDIKRDFVYVEDAVEVILWMLDHPEVSGIFNVGTGQARAFEEVSDQANMMRAAIEMPDALKPTYQFFTQADLTRLRQEGCDVPFRPIEEGVKLYVEKYLSQKERYR